MGGIVWPEPGCQNAAGDFTRAASRMDGPAWNGDCLFASALCGVGDVRRQLSGADQEIPASTNSVRDASHGYDNFFKAAFPGSGAPWLTACFSRVI